MKLKVTGHSRNIDEESIYYVELDRDPQWVTEEDAKQLIERPEFCELLKKNGFDCSRGKPPLMDNPLLSVTDKDGVNVFSLDYYGMKIVHHKAYKKHADRITQWLTGESLIDADERYTKESFERTGIRLSEYVR